MVYICMLFLTVFFISSSNSMLHYNQIALATELSRQFRQAAMEDWNPLTKEYLLNSNSKPAHILNRYINLFVKAAKKRHRPSKTIKEVVDEVKKSYPTQRELEIILEDNISWSQWLCSWIPCNPNPIRTKEWENQLSILEAHLHNEKYNP